jgi:hypothetical protein
MTRCCPKPTGVIFWVAILLCVSACGCRSRGIDVTVQNNAAVPLRNVEVDYPGAAFGTPSIKPGGSYWYHIKPSDDGDLTLSFEQENGSAIKRKIATVKSGQAGRLIILVVQKDGKWTTSLAQTGGLGANSSPSHP